MICMELFTYLTAKKHC